jgi:thioredoxin-dependent peroxiredoxin
MARLSYLAVCSLAALACGACGASQPAPAAQHTLPSTGTEVPALARVDQRGQTVVLRAGVPTLLYFYPKNGTPGCTKEACAIRDAWNEYRLVQLRVIGVSVDSEESHRAFADEHGLPFSLISDPTHTWSNAFGVGTFKGGLDERVSFLIDAKNRIVKVYENVDPGVHASEVLDDARALGLTAAPDLAPAPAP